MTKYEGPQVRSQSITFDRLKANDEKREIPASLSSDAPVPMPWGDEILSHEPGAIDLTRAGEQGLVMLFNHDPNQPIGRIKDIKIEDGKTRGVMHFSNNAKAREVYQDVKDGFLSDTSIKYDVSDYEERDEALFINRWSIIEGSIVTIPADPSVGVNRSKQEDRQMDELEKAKAEIERLKAEKGNVVEFSAARDMALAEGQAEGQRLERERIDGIRSLFALPKFQAPVYQQLSAEAIRQGWSKATTSDKLLELVGDGVAPVVDVNQQDNQRAAEHGESQDEKFSGIITDTLSVRGGIEKDAEKIKEVNASGYRGYSMMEIAREYLHLNNVATKGMNRRELSGKVFSRSLISHGTDDFTGILANVASKSALMGWSEAPETWMMWTRQGNLTDFKSADRSGLGEFPDLDLVYENGAYKFASMNDRKESLQLATYGKKFSISRQAIINDDLSEFTTIPRKMGRAANRKIGDIAYAILTGNPTLAQDSTSLFDAATHGNYVANGSGGAPATATLDTAFAAMRTQQDNDGNATSLNIVPKYLIGPAALEATILALVNNTYDPTGTAGSLLENRYKGRLIPVIDARIDANDAAKWFLAADPDLHDTVEVAFLDGQSEPYLEQQEGTDADGVEFKVRIDAVAGALGYQGLYHNDGN